jgi:two-component system response regulator AtoC
MTKTHHVLIIDDDKTVRNALAGALEQSGYRTTTADGLESARRCLGEAAFDAVLLDIRLRDGDGLEFLESLKVERPHVPIIMATAYGDSDRTIRAMKAGAFEYVTKPFDFDALLSTVARAVHSPPLARVASAGPDPSFVGSSPAMLEVWKAIGRAAASPTTVLITGESGVGKELVARALHAHGTRRGPFIAVNVAALPTALVESELFGHEKGAFTGATQRREGRFELASGGTLFLDEIGDLDSALQTKLLRVLEDGGFERVGGATRIVSDARILAATSRPVTPGSPGATLREDLYYRLGVVHIEVPPLRQRRQDIPMLVETFLHRAPGPRRAISAAAMQMLERHSWPGNVRQLRHAVENACVMSNADVLDCQDFGLPIESSDRPSSAPSSDDNLNLRQHLERVERALIVKALAVAGGNRAQAARLLGIRRALLYARILQLGLHGEVKE